MSAVDINTREILEAVEKLRQEVSRLSERLAAVETRLCDAERAAVEQKRGAERMDEELSATIGAAVAAYLGCKPRIRQIRLIGGASWAQQGRATIQASHVLSHRG